jgi:hypothetical protein
MWASSEVRQCDGLRWHIYIPSLMKIGSGIRVISRVLPQQFERLWCWYYRLEGCMIYTIEIGTGVQAILRLYLRNVRGFSVGITDGMDL